MKLSNDICQLCDMTAHYSQGLSRDADKVYL